MTQDRLRAIYRAYARDPAFDSLRSHGGPKRVVPGRGSMTPRFVIVGEAPGGKEATTRKPFMGPAGQVMTSVLSSVGIARREIFITNVVKIRPTIGTNVIRNRTPRPAEQDASWSYLMAELDVFGNVPVIACGNIALRAMLPSEFGRGYISEWHGQGWTVAGRRYWAMYHPAVAVYDPTMMPTLLEDMALIMEAEK
jgi:uracil-DNA glycosylase